MRLHWPNATHSTIRRALRLLGRITKYRREPPWRRATDPEPDLPLQPTWPAIISPYRGVALHRGWQPPQQPEQHQPPLPKPRLKPPNGHRRPTHHSSNNRSHYNHPSAAANSSGQSDTSPPNSTHLHKSFKPQASSRSMSSSSKPPSVEHLAVAFGGFQGDDHPSGAG